MTPTLTQVLGAYETKLEMWWASRVGKETAASGKRKLLDLDTWLAVLTSQRLVGEWEVEQLSAITGDPSAKGNLRIRLSIPTCKAAFMDSQNVEQLGVGQAHSGSAQAVLDFQGEFQECLARVGIAKYSSIQQLTPAKKVEAFLQNFFGEFGEVEIMRDATYIRAERFDVDGLSKPREGESAADHAAFVTVFKGMQVRSPTFP